MFKCVRLTRDRGGDKAGGLVSLPAGEADSLVLTGAAVPQAAGSAAAPAGPPDVLAAFEELKADYAEVQAAGRRAADELAAAKAVLAEYEAENEKLAADLKAAESARAAAEDQAKKLADEMKAKAKKN